MRKFWGFYDNNTYRVGCNGGTIYIYDQNNIELGKFKDIKYAYEGAFQPNTNIFVAKSTEGSLAVYDLDKMLLLKKIVITRIGAQDEGFAFSPDGKLFFNIEKPYLSTRTQLTVYSTIDYQVIGILFQGNHDICLETLEFDKASRNCYIFGFARNSKGIFDYGFVGKLVRGKIVKPQKLTEKEYDYIRAYKSWELSGYTAKTLELSNVLKNLSDRPHVSLREIYHRR